MASLKFVEYFLASFPPNQPVAEASRKLAVGKGTGNFLEAEKVASPQLVSRLRGNDGGGSPATAPNFREMTLVVNLECDRKHN